MALRCTSIKSFAFAYCRTPARKVPVYVKHDFAFRWLWHFCDRNDPSLDELFEQCQNLCLIECKVKPAHTRKPFVDASDKAFDQLVHFEIVFYFIGHYAEIQGRKPSSNNPIIVDFAKCFASFARSLDARQYPPSLLFCPIRIIPPGEKNSSKVVKDDKGFDHCCSPFTKDEPCVYAVEGKSNTMSNISVHEERS